MSRSLNKFNRVYVDGYDLSGYARTVGPLTWTFEEAVDDAMNASVKGAWPGMGTVGAGTLNALFDNTATSGIHAVLGSGGVKRTVLVACGMEAAPASLTSPCFGGQFLQTDYIAAPSDSPVALTINFANTAQTASNMTYCSPWGILLHALGAETGASTATGHDGGAATAKGGFMVYQVTAGNGTATIKVQDAATNSNGSFSDLLSSGSISCAAGVSGIVPLANTATVRQYTRFQIALGTATTVTFALGFFRNLI